MALEMLFLCGFLVLCINFAFYNKQFLYNIAGYIKQNGFSVHKAMYFNWLKLVFFLNK
jgi:hypothetical protein